MTTPTVREFMTPSPTSIGRHDTLAEAHRLMREHGIRHLPVIEDGHLEGVVSERDLSTIEVCRDVTPEATSVEEAMMPVCFTVSPDAKLDEVAERMYEHRWGSAVVVDEGKVVGIFTTVDALRALVKLVGRLRRAPSRRTKRG